MQLNRSMRFQVCEKETTTAGDLWKAVDFVAHRNAAIAISLLTNTISELLGIPMCVSG